MAPARGRSRARQQLRKLTPMAAAIVAALGVIAALAFFVLPADADPKPSRPEGTLIAAPTQRSLETPTGLVPETPKPTLETIATEAIQSQDAMVAGDVADNSQENVEPTPSARVIRRPQKSPTAVPTTASTASSILKPLPTADRGSSRPTPPPPLVTRQPFPTAIPGPIVSATRTPTGTATVTVTPKSTRTPRPTQTAVPVATSTRAPEPTATASPTVTATLPAPTDTPVPTLIPSPIATQVPTNTATPFAPTSTNTPTGVPQSETPERTNTAEPSPTKTPTREPKKTATPEPSPTKNAGPGTPEPG